MGLAFFGLTSTNAQEVRLNLFTQIHQVVFHGNGGYSWFDVYNMPVWLRKFTYSELQKHYDKEKQAIENSKNNNKKTLVDSSGKVNTPEFLKAAQEFKGKSNYS